MSCLVPKFRLKEPVPTKRLPSQEEAEAAVRVLLHWAGEDPERPGLKETPRRVALSYAQLFEGYAYTPQEAIGTLFEDPENGQACIFVSNIAFHSLCEHHMLPFIGVAHLAYYPGAYLAGLSGLARLVDMFARRLQTQEAMTIQIGQALEEVLGARGVGVILEAEHMCMAMRGVQKPGAKVVTQHVSGLLAQDPQAHMRFFTMLLQKTGQTHGASPP